MLGIRLRGGCHLVNYCKTAWPRVFHGPPAQGAWCMLGDYQQPRRQLGLYEPFQGQIPLEADLASSPQLCGDVKQNTPDRLLPVTPNAYYQPPRPC